MVSPVGEVRADDPRSGATPAAAAAPAPAAAAATPAPTAVATLGPATAGATRAPSTPPRSAVPPGREARGASLLLFTGFLGSGKTTLLLGLAREVTARGKKTAFIVNEIGEIGIDQQVMRDGGLEVYEITSGCICCQIGVDLVITLQTLAATYEPDLIVVEASGVATPGGVVKALTYYKGPPFAQVRSIGVLDPTRLEALFEVVTPLIESQIREVDEVVITKSDEATSDERARAHELAGRLNPRAPISEVCALDSAALTEWALRLVPAEAPARAPDDTSSGGPAEQPPAGRRPSA